MLGKEQKANLYEHIRKINGHARISLFAEEMKEILMFNSEVKNWLALPALSVNTKQS